MNPQEIAKYLNDKLQPFKGTARIMLERHHIKVTIDIPQKGIHIFSMSAFEDVDTDKLDKKLSVALMALGA